ncbi:MAG: hypothetical protein WDM80_15745 [Limisphaerales bacterium]
MKTILNIVLASLVSLLLTGLPARADLIQATDPSFGLNSLTIDTSTGLGWLDLTASTGLSYQQVLADTQTGGIYSGFRFATAEEVLSLYSHAGIPSTGNYSLSSPEIQSLISLLGFTELVNGQPGFIGLSGTTSLAGAQDAPAIYPIGVPGFEQYFVNGGDAGYGGGTQYGVTFSDSSLGSWLVTEVPEPSQVSMLLLATTILAILKTIRRKIYAA